MIPVLHAEQIKKADAYTIDHTPIGSCELMEQAMMALLPRVIPYLHGEVWVICGMGNNGGDGLVLSGLLQEAGYAVKTIVLEMGTTASEAFGIQLQKLRSNHAVSLDFITDANELHLPSKTVVIDAIFGNGLNRPVEGPFRQIIEHINRHDGPVYSIDVPSGFMIDGNNTGQWVKSKKTFVLGYPKMGLWDASKEIDFEVVDIGLLRSFDTTLSSCCYMLEPSDLNLPIRHRFSYKNTWGHICIWGGYKGMFGAPLLSSLAAFKMGSGLVTCATLTEGLAGLSIVIPEALTYATGETYHMELPENANSLYQALGIGPGMGRDKRHVDLLSKLLQNTNVPLVIDADALNIIGEYDLQDLIPPGSILTPHPGEFRRLTGQVGSFYEVKDALIRFATQIQSVVVLKGTYTMICGPDSELYFNHCGGSSLATAGSGDVLTGMITALRGMGYGPLQSAIQGVLAHGLIGKKLGNKPCMASEIIREISTLYGKGI
jgi:ADP-dependent NAD(P)H-hydrate dehydratase / NAD(P)H-hydrate epimerase